MDDNTTLVSVTRNQLADLCETRYKEQIVCQKDLTSSNVRSAIRCAIEALQALPILQSQTLTHATFQVPKVLFQGLNDGSLSRIGSVVRCSKSGKIVSHLNEVKPSNLAKVGKAGFGLCMAALGVAEQVLLNEKLAEINDLLKAVDAKLEAQNQGLLRSAFDSAARLDHVIDPQNRRLKVHLIQQDLALAAGIYQQLYDSEWKAIERELSAFRTAKLYNDDSLPKLCEHASVVLKNLEVVCATKLLHAQLNEKLNEPEALAIESALLTQLLATELSRFIKVFGPDSELRDLKLYKSPRYMVESWQDSDHQNTVRALNDQCNGLDELLSRQLLLEATGGTLAVRMLPNNETLPLSSSKKSRWQKLKALLS